MSAPRKRVDESEQGHWMYVYGMDGAISFTLASQHIWFSSVQDPDRRHDLLLWYFGVQHSER